jgi:hypothetical protein
MWLEKKLAHIVTAATSFSLLKSIDNILTIDQG